uniref:Lipocalin n=1 Tax=Argas monolakensis TaxID=34602 RepID=Q09JW0_ARGMO|nr:lipocalin [Argas monolakensis]
MALKLALLAVFVVLGASAVENELPLNVWKAISKGTYVLIQRSYQKVGATCTYAKIKTKDQSTHSYTAEMGFTLNGKKMKNTYNMYAAKETGKNTRNVLSISSKPLTDPLQGELYFLIYRDGKGCNILFAQNKTTRKDLECEMWVEKNVADNISEDCKHYYNDRCMAVVETHYSKACKIP